MKKITLLVLTTVFLVSISCKKNNTDDGIQNLIANNWSGSYQITGAATVYPFSMNIKLDKTMSIVDSAFSNEVFAGTYTYTTDSLNISYNNGTKWNMRFSTDYTVASGTIRGYTGLIGTVNMKLVKN